ncbi:MAG TPA: cytochrome c [Roseiflexaceae bacterium]|nr:cytochrome c [Roseiflexaceae bacterium]
MLLLPHTCRLLAALLLGALALLAACAQAATAPAPTPDPAILATGDPARGAQLYGARCAACHAPDRTAGVGPGLGGLFSPSGPSRPAAADYGANLPSGLPINEANVALWVRTGGRGKIGYMPPSNLDDRQLADLIAHLKTLSGP